MRSRAYGFLYRYLTAAVKSVQLLALTARLWPFPAWLKVWTCRREEVEVGLGGRRLLIRSRRLHVKLTDLYMATSCLVDEQYNSRPGFALGESDTVIDIGAHIGSFAVYAAGKAPKGRVFSYEPHAASHAQLLKNLRLNGAANVQAFQEAVAGRAGTRTLYAAPLNSAENNLYRGGPRGSEVRALTLEELFARHGIARCDFMKVDCEGAEYEIFLNAPPETLARIRRLGVECHVGRYFGLADPKAVPRTLTAFLERNGFRLETWTENELHTFIWAARP